MTTAFPSVVPAARFDLRLQHVLPHRKRSISIRSNPIQYSRRFAELGLVWVRRVGKDGRMHWRFLLRKILLTEAEGEREREKLEEGGGGGGGERERERERVKAEQGNHTKRSDLFIYFA